MAAVDGYSLPRLPRSPSPTLSPMLRERPLPPIPVGDERPSPTTRASATMPQPSSVALGKRKAPAVPVISSSEGLHRMLKSPHILSRLLELLPWSSFHALICTCRDFRRIYSQPELRDVVLSRFVPGYKLCLGNRDVAELSVDVTLEDLALFRKC